MDVERFTAEAGRLGEILLYCLPGELEAKKDHLSRTYGLLPPTSSARAFWRYLVEKLGLRWAAALCVEEFFRGKSDPEAEIRSLISSQIPELKRLGEFLERWGELVRSQEFREGLERALVPFRERRLRYALAQEAAALGKRLLLLIPGSLRERRRYLEERHGIRVPVTSYADQWRALVERLGDEGNAALFLLRAFLQGPWDRRALLDRWRRREALRPLVGFVERYGTYAGRPEVGRRLERHLRRVASPKEAPYLPPARHREAVELLRALGEAMGYRVETEYPSPDGLYRYDVIWFRPGARVPEKVFEVNVGGDVDRALARLKHALDLWRHPRLYLVVRSLRDLVRAERLVKPLLSGTFHEIQGHLSLISLEDLQRIPLATLRELLR